MSISHAYGDDAPARLRANGYRQTFEALGVPGRGCKTSRATPDDMEKIGRALAAEGRKLVLAAAILRLAATAPAAVGHG